MITKTSMFFAILLISITINCNRLQKDIGSKLNRMAQNPESIYSIKELFKEEWDNVYIFNAESTSEDILIRTGILLDEYVSTGEQLLLLEADGKLIRLVRIPSHLFRLKIVGEEEFHTVSSKTTLYYVKRTEGKHKQITYTLTPL